MASFTPIDPNILFQQVTPNYFKSYGEGIKLGQLMRQAPLAEEQQRLANEEAQIKLNQLMDPQSILNQMEQLKLQQQQGVIARQPFEQQLLQSQIKTQEQQQEKLYAEENERNRMLAAEQDLATIAQKYYDPANKKFDSQGFVGESLMKYPILTADKLLDIANKFKYGFGQEESLWDPVGAKVEQNGRYKQPERHKITGQWRMTDLGVAPVKPIAAKDLTQTETKYRNEYDKKTEDFFGSIKSYNRLQELAKDKTGASDLAIIFSYMKVLDPASTVREGEFATAENSGGVPDKIINQYNKVRSGELLNYTMRENFINSSKTLVKSSLNSQKQTEKYYEDLAKRKGIDPTNVISRRISDVGFSEENLKEDQATLPLANPKYGKAYPVKDVAGQYMQWTKGGTPNPNDRSGWINVRVK